MCTSFVPTALLIRLRWTGFRSQTCAKWLLSIESSRPALVSTLLIYSTATADFLHQVSTDGSRKLTDLIPIHHKSSRCGVQVSTGKDMVLLNDLRRNTVIGIVIRLRGGRSGVRKPKGAKIFFFSE